MEIYRDSCAAPMPLTYADPGATGRWQSSGAAAALAPPGHEGTTVPFAAAVGFPRTFTGFTPEMRITGPVADVRIIENDPSTHVPGTHAWSPPV